MARMTSNTTQKTAARKATEMVNASVAHSRTHGGGC